MASLKKNLGLMQNDSLFDKEQRGYSKKNILAKAVERGGG